MDLVAPRLKPRPDHRLGGAFAIGARDMDGPRQALFGMAERGKKAVHAVQGQIDDLGMQGHHPFKHGVRARAHFAGTAAGAGRSPTIAGDCPESIRRMVTNSSRIFLRWVTRSSMPWSKRYSAR